MMTDLSYDLNTGTSIDYQISIPISIQLFLGRILGHFRGFVSFLGPEGDKKSGGGPLFCEPAPLPRDLVSKNG